MGNGIGIGNGNGRHRALSRGDARYVLNESSRLGFSRSNCRAYSSEKLTKIAEEINLFRTARAPIDSSVISSFLRHCYDNKLTMEDFD